MSASIQLEGNRTNVPIILPPANIIEPTDARVQSMVLPWWLHLLTLPISAQVTEGLAKIFDFEVLRHGTSFPCYFSILKNGADPARGGEGSSAISINIAEDGIRPEQEASRGHFHVFKDSEADLHDETAGISIPCLGHIMKRTHTRFHAVLAGLAFAKDIQDKIVKTVASIFLAITNFFCPTLRFMYRKSEIHGSNERPGIFETDPDYGNIAYRTTQALPNDRIGLIGLCMQATPEDLMRAWQTNPFQLLMGLVQVIIGIALTIIGVGTFL